MPAIATSFPFLGAIESRIGGREENQDHVWFVDTPIGLLLVVCDGMGGGPGGRTASHTAVDTILSLIKDVSPKTDPKDALCYGIEKANEVLYNMAVENAELRGMGTTVVAMLANENSATVAHVGDSRLYQLRKGNIVFRTADHSQVAELVRAGRLTEEEARNHPRSNIITRALGIRPEVEIDIDHLSFHPQDRFVLCSDGIWGMMPQEQLVQRFTRPMGIIELADLIASEVDAQGFDNGGGHDNLTLAILDTQCSSKDIPAPTSVVESVEAKSAPKVDSARLAERPSAKKGWTYKHSFWTLLVLEAIGIAVFVLLQQEAESPLETTHRIYYTPNVHIDPPAHISSDTAILLEKKTQITSTRREQQENTIHHDSHNLQVEQGVQKVIQHLNELKKIRGNTQQQGKEQKQKYIKKTIIPCLQRIPHKKDDHTSLIIEWASKMLEEPKASACSQKGEPSAESNQFIDTIIGKVNEILQDDESF